MRMLSLIAALLCLTSASARDLTPEELERWFASDDPHPPSVSTDDVNEGQLVFLTRRPDKPVHHHHNAVVISTDSLSEGWVRMQQCHENLDQVAALQILFNKGRTRDLRVVSTRNIGRAWVEGNSIQLEDITREARICLEATTKALFRNDDGSYSLRNGPFMRRFLDGYYPMRVSMQVEYVNSGLQLVAMSPAVQPGFEVVQGQQAFRFDAWFEGRLLTEFRFRPPS